MSSLVDLRGGGGTGGSSAWQTITADPAPVSSGNRFLCNTTSAAFSVTLPAAPATGTKITIADYASTFSTNNLTILRNGANIMGAATDLVLDVDDSSVILEFIGAPKGWLASWVVTTSIGGGDSGYAGPPPSSWTPGLTNFTFDEDAPLVGDFEF